MVLKLMGDVTTKDKIWRVIKVEVVGNTTEREIV